MQHCNNCTAQGVRTMIGSWLEPTRKKYSTKRKQEERDLQVRCVAWLINRNILRYKIHNEGKRHPHQAREIKAQGLLSGAPDLCIPKMRKSYGGLYIEFKSQSGKLTDNQVWVHDELRKEGYRVEVIKNWEQFMDLIKNYFSEDIASGKLWVSERF